MDKYAVNFITLVSILFCYQITPLLAATDDTARRERFSSVFISDTRIDQLKEAVEKKIEPTYTAFQAMRQYATENLHRQPLAHERWHVPFFYRDKDGHRRAKHGLRDDANAAYAMALCYRITGDKRYAQSSLRLINAWPATLRDMSREADSNLTFSYHFPAMIFAADLLRDQGELWPQADQEVFRSFLKDRALVMNTMEFRRQNNQANWGLVLVLSCAVYLEDEALFERGEDRWRQFIRHQIDENGHLHREVNRDRGRRGIWYSHFTLLPQTIAAEILRINGLDLYEYESAGRKMQSAFDVLAAWVALPDTFPYFNGDPEQMISPNAFSYFEILNARWPNPHAIKLLRESRPMTADQSAPFLTFTHGQLLPEKE